MRSMRQEDDRKDAGMAGNWAILSDFRALDGVGFAHQSGEADGCDCLRNPRLISLRKSAAATDLLARQR
jgi:hypothetical protein